jgi:hypothetical protein
MNFNHTLVVDPAGFEMLDLYGAEVALVPPARLPVDVEMIVWGGVLYPYGFGKSPGAARRGAVTWPGVPAGVDTYKFTSAVRLVFKQVTRLEMGLALFEPSEVPLQNVDKKYLKDAGGGVICWKLSLSAPADSGGENALSQSVLYDGFECILRWPEGNLVGSLEAAPYVEVSY